MVTLLALMVILFGVVIAWKLLKWLVQIIFRFLKKAFVWFRRFVKKHILDFFIICIHMVSWCFTLYSPQLAWYRHFFMYTIPPFFIKEDVIQVITLFACFFIPFLWKKQVVEPFNDWHKKWKKQHEKR